MRKPVLCLTLANILLLTLVFTGCRKEKAVNAGLSSYYFYSEDNNKILYDVKTGIMSLVTEDYKDVTGDVDNFTVISQHFGKDSKNIYYTYKVLTNVDHSSFFWDEGLGLPKDKNHVYLPKTDSDALTVIKDADPDTYERVDLSIPCLSWYRDKKLYFYNHEKTNADRASLNFKIPYLPYDNKYVFWVEKDKVKQKEYTGSIVVINQYMLKDDRSYYLKEACDSVFRSIDYERGDRFRFYDEHLLIFQIGTEVFFRGLKFLEGTVDADSFELLDTPYSKDKKNVYYGDKIIKDADPATFEIITYRYAKDKKRVYKYGKELPEYKPDEFVKDEWGRFPDESNYGKEPPRRTSSSRRSWRDDDD